MAKEVAKNPKRFAGFCVLSMHDPDQAAAELRRSVTELGLKGAIINDFQSAGLDGETMLMYDQPEYDPFWAAVQVRKPRGTRSWVPLAIAIADSISAGA